MRIKLKLKNKSGVETYWIMRPDRVVAFSCMVSAFVASGELHQDVLWNAYKDCDCDIKICRLAK